MKYVRYELHFSTAVHFGTVSLTDARFTLLADTIFSALCQEAIQQGESELQALISDAQSGKFVLSDGLPFVNDVYFLPKPLIPIQKNNIQDMRTQKQCKKMQYLPMDFVNAYVNGALPSQQQISLLQSLGTAQTRTFSNLRHNDSAEALPYVVGVYQFSKYAGIYILMGFETAEIQKRVETLIDGLCVVGIGGKRSAGLGKFTYTKTELQKHNIVTPQTQKQNGLYMTLSISMAEPERLQTVLHDAYYQICSRTGFISSTNYAPEPHKKRTLFLFESGSCFRKLFSGEMYDVSCGGNHAVYRYAKPMFWEAKNS